MRKRRLSGLPPRLEMLCERFDEEGLGIGTVQGLELHVPRAVPGDRLDVQVEHRSPHGAHAWGRMVALRSPSRDRVDPACENVGRCGGCVLQCAAYPLQLRFKQEQVACALGTLVPEIEPIVPSPALLHYRNKAKLVATRRLGRVILGAFAPRSHEVVDMAGCQVTELPLGAAAKTTARLLDEMEVPLYDEQTGAGLLRYVILRVNWTGQVLVVLVTRERAFPQGPRLATALSGAHPQIAGIVQNVNPSPGGVLLGEEEHLLVGAGELEDEIGGVRLKLSARAFFQVNRAQAAALYAAVDRAARQSAPRTVVDVYSGVGGIALTLARGATHVVAIEQNHAAAADARRSARASGASNVEVRTGDAREELARAKQADLIVLNPPRKGCDARVLAASAALRPQGILYVSCHPRSLARDLALLGTLGYRARRAQPFDMLPHTPHIEVLTVLSRDA